MGETPPKDMSCFAEFDSEGVLLAASPGFLGTGARTSTLTAYLESFEQIDGCSDLTPETRAASLAAWRSPGSCLEARRADGSWQLLTSHPTASGGHCFCATDITERKLHQDLARVLSLQGPMAAYANDLESGQLLFMNARARALFEVDDEPLPKLEALFPDPDESRYLAGMLREHGRIDNHRRRAQAAGGRDFWIDGSATLTQVGGRHLCLATVQEVSPLDREQSAPGQSQELLSDALRSLGEAFALFDEDARLVICNERYRELNSAIEGFISPGVHWETLLRETARKGNLRHAVGREAAWVNDTMQLADSYRSFEIEHLDGTAIAVSVHPTSLGGFILIEVDITKRKAAEKAAKDSEDLLSKILVASPANLCMSHIGTGEVIYRSPACASLFGPETSARDQFADPVDRADFLTDLLPFGRVDDFAANARNAAGRELSRALLRPCYRLSRRRCHGVLRHRLERAGADGKGIGPPTTDAAPEREALRARRAPGRCRS